MKELRNMCDFYKVQTVNGFIETKIDKNIVVEIQKSINDNIVGEKYFQGPPMLDEEEKLSIAIIERDNYKLHCLITFKTF